MKGPPGMDGEKGVPGIAGPRVCTFSVYKPQIRPGKIKNYLSEIYRIHNGWKFVYFCAPSLTNKYTSLINYQTYDVNP